ncbi:hypothetical protein [Dielma fastidiosa]|uniref:hypothetical protein n=1 Tax=Dielma fastidiosa TaxID=1034346 RepID=UPI000E4F2CBF|nr:hypothetical protein [Dielma fastidiosa]RHN00129.1 hypothetical protein DWZ33_10065 [Dielma fastidiosa]
MQFTLEYFANERYELLKLLCDNQVKVKDSFYVTLSQQEIADIAHISKLKANKIINELIEQDCLYLYNNKRGKYALTEKGLKVLQLIQRNNM